MVQIGSNVVLPTHAAITTEVHRTVARESAGCRDSQQCGGASEYSNIWQAASILFGSFPCAS